MELQQLSLAMYQPMEKPFGIDKSSYWYERKKLIEGNGATPTTAMMCMFYVMFMMSWYLNTIER